MYKSTKYIIATSAAVIILLLAIPYFVTLDSYKETIISRVKEQIGRDLKIEGKIGLALLPAPKIILTKIKLSSLPEAKAANLIEIESIQAKLALLPLFAGKIAISSLEIEKPVINLERLKNDKGTWEFDASSADNHINREVSTPEKDKNINANFLASLPFIINDINIKDGSLQYIDKDKVTTVNNLDLDIAIAGINGPIDFVLGFKALGEDLALKGRIKEVTEQLPISLDIQAFGEKINIDGRIDKFSTLFTGIIQVEGNLKNKGGDFIPAGLQRQHNLTAEISADKEAVILEDIKLGIDSITGIGKITYNLNTAASNIELELNPGNIKLSLVSGNQNQDGLDGAIKLTAGNLDAFAKAIEWDISQLPLTLNSDLSLNSGIFYGDQAFLLKNMVFNLGKIQVKGGGGIKNWSKKSVLPYDLSIADAGSLLKLLGYKTPINLAQVRIAGETTIDQKTLLTNTQITAAKATVTVKGKIGTEKDAKSSFLVNVAGSNLSQTLHELLSQTYNPSLGAFNITAQIDGDLASGKSLSAVIDKGNKSSLVIGGETTYINSKLNLDSSAEKPRFTLDLSLSAIKLPASNNSRASAGATTSSHSTQAAGGHWSHEKIDLTALGNVNGTIILNVQKLINGSLVFDNIAIKSELTDGVLKFTSLTGGLYGGKLEGSGSLSSKGDKPISLKMFLKGAELRNIAPEGKKIKVTGGIVDFTGDIQSQGISQFDYISNLHGNIILNGKDGKISGIDLQKITHALSKPKDLSSLGQSLEDSVSKGETIFSKLSVETSIATGIMNLTRCDLTSSEASATTQGQINLPQFSLDAITTVNSGVKNLPPVKVHFYGSLDNPQHKIDVKAIWKYLADNALTGILDNIQHGKISPKDILKGILDGGHKSNEAGDSNEKKDEDKDAPADDATQLLQKGINSLFKQ